MSLLQGVTNVVSGIQTLFGRQNASQLSDCIGAAGQYGTQQALAMYPQCAPYASSMNVPIGTPNPRIPATASVAPPTMIPPQLPQAMPGGMPTMQATNPMNLPVSYQPAMAVLPQIAGAAGTMARAAAPLVAGAVGTVTAAAKKLLPLLNKNIALASGYAVVGALVYDQAGRLVGKIRKRRRVNPLNYRAAKRAARRLCMVRDLCGQIDKAIPTRPARARRRVYAFQRKRKTCR